MMNIITTDNTADTHDKMLGNESELCFGAAAGCFIVGAVGWLVNLVQPDTTLLHGLLVVAGFYGFLGVVSLFKRPAPTEEAVHQTCGNESNESTGLRGCANTELKSAA